MESSIGIDKLAIFSGKPLFDENLYVGRPNIGNRERFMERINDIFDRRWFTNNGQYVQEFERKLADFIGVKHCIAMCNATIALEIVIRGLGLTGEVIVPSFTFVATPHALQWQQITPVFCDIDPVTHNLDPRRVEEMITPRTTGIIGVHVWGRPCAIEELTEIAERRGLKLLFDAAHAFACSHKGSMIGSFGDAEVFSFHATKFFNTFEGGAVATNNDELAAQIRLMKNFGFAGYDNVDFIGTNGKMTEVSAAMGLSSFEGLDEFIEVNRRNYGIYRQELADVPGIRLIDYTATEKCNYQYVILEIDETVSGLNRDQLVKILHAENVFARRYFYPGCHQMEPYRSYFPHASLLLPQTERLATRVMSLPTGTAVSAEDVANICGIIRMAVSHGTELGERLHTQG
jgi:dTDP-4-amino-4,6-dideoxygalactose transaminase